MTVKYKKEGVSKYQNIKFRKCEKKDFTERKLLVENHQEKQITHNKICPSDDEYHDIWKVKNSYHNKTERISFNIEAIECEGP